MLITKKIIGSALAAVALFAAALPTGAVPIAPGTSIPAVGEPDPIGGGIIFQTNIFFSSASFNGILQSTVILGDATNPFGGLTFTYQFNINLGSPDSAKDITIGSLGGGFGGYFTDVSYQVPTGTWLAPSSISRSPTGGGRNITFDFAGVGYLPAGSTSALLVVQTDASDWVFGNSSIQDDVASPIVLTVVPAVPEPTSLALLALGGVGLAVMKRRQRS